MVAQPDRRIMAVNVAIDFCIYFSLFYVKKNRVIKDNGMVC